MWINFRFSFCHPLQIQVLLGPVKPNITERHIQYPEETHHRKLIFVQALMPQLRSTLWPETISWLVSLCHTAKPVPVKIFNPFFDKTALATNNGWCLNLSFPGQIIPLFILYSPSGKQKIPLSKNLLLSPQIVLPFTPPPSTPHTKKFPF